MSAPDALVQLANLLGAPEQKLAILGEGNVSALDGRSFWVKASGRQMHGIGSDGFARCDRSLLANAVEEPEPLDDQVVANLLSRNPGPKASVEAFMHAWLLGLEGVTYVGHVHGEATLALLCTEAGQSLCSQRFFPDEVVLCGPATLWVPYTDPGIALAKKVAQRCRAWIERHGSAPRLIALENHGTIALGSTPETVKAALFMSEKAARVVATALATGSPLVAMSAGAVKRIHERKDEHERQATIWSSHNAP